MTEHRTNRTPTAVLVAARNPRDNAGVTEEALEELSRLLDTLGIDAEERYSVQIRQSNPRLLIGSGKADEIIKYSQEHEVDYIVFDDELTPSQQRNWERSSGISTMDRHQVILDIFGKRARTREARLQVELAQMEYQLPRLTRAWTHLSRQRGGTRGTRGEGEKQIEYDKRMITERITKLRRELERVEKQRATRRKRRRDVPVPTAAIVGYTNAGKSSLLRALTDAEVQIENKLFATLDPTTRRVALPDSREVLLTDTVGFIRKLPHDLVDAFHSTLEEAVLADFLIHVVDGSSPEAVAFYHETNRVLEELGAGDKPVITLLNKSDRVTDDHRLEALISAINRVDGERPIVRFSAKNGLGTEELLREIQTLVQTFHPEREYLLPHDRHDLVAHLHRNGVILTEEYHNEGVHIRASVPESAHAAVAEYAVPTEHFTKLRENRML